MSNDEEGVDNLSLGECSGEEAEQFGCCHCNIISVGIRIV